MLALDGDLQGAALWGLGHGEPQAGAAHAEVTDRHLLPPKR